MVNKYARQAKAAQKRLRKERSCENKKAYETEERAAKTGNDTYHCPYCKKWHTTAAQKTLINTLKKRLRQKLK
jgi:hypothetical protein